MRSWPQILDKVLALTCLAFGALSGVGLALINARNVKGPATYDPDDIYLDIISSVALLLFLSYGLWRHRAWAYVGLGLGSGAFCVGMIAIAAHPLWSWPAAAAFALLAAFSIWRFWLEPKPV